MKKLVLFAVSFSVLALGAFAAGNQEKDTMMKTDNTMMKSNNDTMMKSDNNTMKSDNDTMMKSDNTMMKSDAGFYDLSGLGSQIVPFTSEMAATSLAKSQTVVYFFAASWCPDCQAIYKDLRTNFAQVPKDITIVVVNYDKSSDLKKKYGITIQHTFVQVDSKGDKIKAWSGARSLNDILKNLGRA